MKRLTRQRGEEFMPFAFDRRKAVQAVGVLLKTRAEATDNYMRLLKILYMADRESIKETGVPITGDAFVAMEHGTMLSRLLNLAKGVMGHLDRKPDHAEWDMHFARKSKYEIQMVQDPGVDALCDYEISKLNEVAERYKDQDQYAMREVTHGLAEYHDQRAGQQDWIPLREVLNAVGLAKVAGHIEEEAKADAELRRLMEG